VGCADGRGGLGGGRGGGGGGVRGGAPRRPAENTGGGAADKAAVVPLGALFGVETVRMMRGIFSRLPGRILSQVAPASRPPSGPPPRGSFRGPG